MGIRGGHMGGGGQNPSKSCFGKYPLFFDDGAKGLHLLFTHIIRSTLSSLQPFAFSKFFTAQSETLPLSAISHFLVVIRDFDNCFSSPLILPPFGCLPSRSLKFFSGFTNAGLLTLVHLTAFSLAPLFWGGCGGKVEIWTEEEEKERKKIAAAWVWFG